MGVMTEKMKRMLSEQRLAFVATVGADGAPNLSPKGSVRALDDDHLVFADIRSPETVANLAAHPMLEVNVVDTLSRTGYRFKGRAEVLREGPAFEHALQHLRREGVARPIRAVVVVQVEQALRHSLLFGLYHEKRQVGFARVVTDYATFAYLADVFVLEDYRGRGLGAWLVETVVSHPDLQGLRRWLLATRDAHDLYRKAGFDLLAHPEWFMECYNPRLYEPEAEQ